MTDRQTIGVGFWKDCPSLLERDENVMGLNQKPVGHDDCLILRVVERRTLLFEHHMNINKHWNHESPTRPTTAAIAPKLLTFDLKAQTQFNLKFLSQNR